MSNKNPPKTAETLLHQGYRLHQQGRWDLATAAYTEVLKQHPKNFDALHLLGILALQTKDFENAAVWLNKALAVNPEDSQAHSNLGVALHAIGRGLDALKSFESAIKLDPDFAEAYYNCGKILRELGQLENALACYNTAIKLRSDYIEALNNRCEVLLALQRPEEAWSGSDELLKLHPGNPGALGNRGGALFALGQMDAALASLSQALQINPNMPKCLFNRGHVLAQLGRREEAFADFESAIALHSDPSEQSRLRAEALHALKRDHEALTHVEYALILNPDYAEALVQRGLILNALNRPADALASLEQAFKLRPNSAEILAHLGNILMRLNKYSEARKDYEKAVAISPGNHTARWNLCLCLLLLGQFIKGWEEYGIRWSTIGRGSKPGFRKPPWDGKSTSGKLLIWGEQGVGDQIIYASMIREVALHAPHLTIATDQRLHTLFRRSFPDVEFTSIEQAIANEAFDAQLPMGDLGRYLRRTDTDFLHNRVAYLKADTQRAASLRQSLGGAAARLCGLSWNSSNNLVGLEKSMALHDLLPLLSTPEYSFIDLQYGDTTAEREALRRKTGLEVTREASIDTWNDIDGLAALIEACDIIVTISNTTTHIAGALGKEVYLILPYSQGRFWYWQTERSDTLWYPNVRVFRQPAEGDWASVIAQVRDALAARTAIRS